MHVTVGELIGNFILIAGSFILLLVLIKKFAWSNITGIFEERAEKIASDIDRAEEARQKAEVLAQKREDELAGSCLLYTSPSPRDLSTSRMPSSA